MKSRYKIYPLKQFIEQVRGISYKKNEVSEEPKEGYIPLLKANNIQQGKLDYNDLIYVDKKLVKDKQLIRKGDIVIAASSGSKKIVGKSGQSNEDANLTFGAFCKLIRPRNGIDPDYLGYYLKTKYYSTTISSIVNGANINNLRNEHIDNLFIPVPNIETQQKIASILKESDSLIEKRKAQIEALDELTKSLFLEMFGDPAVNINNFDRSMLIKACENNDDIRCGPFGTQLHATEFVNIGTPLWGIKHVNNDFKVQTNEFVTIEKARKLKNYTLLSGDLVMTRKGTVGNCAIYPEEFPEGIMHSDLLRIRVNSKVLNPTYLMFQLKLSREIEHQLSQISSGAIMKGINVTKLKEVIVQIPPIHLQNKFEGLIKNVQFQKNILNLSNEELTNMNSSLIQRAFKGELFTQEKVPSA